MEPRRVLVICTGNICRSPMGEAFLRAHLAARGLLHVEVSSAGTHAQVGRGTLPSVIQASAAIGTGSADRQLLEHVARQVDLVMAREADLILCAAREHREHLLAWWPDLGAERVRLFNEPISGNAPVDVDDPYGWDRDVFELAARVIDRAMAAWAERIARTWPPPAAGA
ncbi:MAG TPA: low molecular weight protein-tyrosine-phosphatase [Planctomycetota bacterium]|nr:low molecular weight protein-tyrosine-phosphatase [Planctomycetota bacterium]